MRTKTARLIVPFGVRLTHREIETIGKFGEGGIEVVVNRLRDRALRRGSFCQWSDRRDRLLFCLRRDHAGNHRSTLFAAGLERRIGLARGAGGDGCSLL